MVECNKCNRDLPQGGYKHENRELCGLCYWEDYVEPKLDEKFKFKVR